MGFGQLQQRKASEPISEINVTPLVDVMLVLVVIFILTAPLLVSAVRLELPRAGAAAATEALAPLLVSIDAQGQLFLDQKPQDLAGLTATLAPIAAQEPQTEVQLRADTAVPYGRVVQVMEALQQAGLGRIAFVTEPAPLTRP